ncbi:hypothetical protein V6N12_020716 [Hibiscus sabdariffa]|uniref:Uncharacterized protein n=1 Tax=Hibiscus sabdariffa TaxID=183260 RepID=A0ABR2CYX3_9ROSI
MSTVDWSDSVYMAISLLGPMDLIAIAIDIDKELEVVGRRKSCRLASGFLHLNGIIAMVKTTSLTVLRTILDPHMLNEPVF